MLMLSINLLIFIPKMIIYYHLNLNLLNLRQSIPEFQRNYVLVPADKAANNVVVV